MLRILRGKSFFRWAGERRADAGAAWFSHSHRRLRRPRRKSCSLQEQFKSIQSSLYSFSDMSSSPLICPQEVLIAQHPSEDFILPIYKVTIKHNLQIIMQDLCKVVCFVSGFHFTVNNYILYYFCLV